MLPLDVFSVIFDILTKDGDFTALKSCALVSRDFPPLCQRHIFSTVKFLRSATAPKFATLLQYNPTLARHVRIFELSIFTSQFDNPLLSRILDQLTNVESFEFYASGSRSLNWLKLDDGLRSAIKRRIQSPNMVHICVPYAIHMPIVALLCNATQLQHLELKVIKAPVLEVSSDEWMYGKIPQLEKLTLTSLSAHAGQALLRARRSDSLPVLDFSSISQLWLETESEFGFEFGQELLPNLLRLEELGLLVSSPASYLKLFESINPSSMKNLQTLNLCSYLSGGDDDQDPLSGLYGGLLLFPAGSLIRRVSVTLFVQKDCSIRKTHWTPLDELLADKTQFPCLNKIDLSVNIEYYKLTRRKLPELLLEMGKMCFQNMRRVYGADFRFAVDNY